MGILGRMPEETLLVRRAAFGELVTAGKPVGFNLVAAATSLTPDTTRRALRLVESAGMAETNEDRVVGIDGLTTRATRHEIELNGVSLWTWCAYDIVGIAAALGADAAGETACGWCNRPIEVAVRKGRPAGGTTVGWLPKESCSNVMEQFCPSALFFCSVEHLERWRAETDRPSGEALDLTELAQRGVAGWRELVSKRHRGLRAAAPWLGSRRTRPGPGRRGRRART